ncbi:ribonuclease P protein component [Nocardioidaceae bacterium]|nr:ribonuclease P protein component [Nocardioidaceae bacterium]
MLPSAHRLTRASDFRDCIRRGARGGSRTLTVHLAPGTESSPRVGLVVSKAVGNAVVRNRVSRRLRHLAADRLATIPPGARVVLRASPAAADCSSAELSADLDRALRTAVGRVARRGA